MALEVRPARRSDAAFLYPWIAERGGRLPGEQRTFGTSRAHRRWHRRALRDPKQLHFIFRHGDEPCAYLRFRRRGSAVDLWLLTTDATDGAAALAPALRDALEQLRIHWSPTRVTVAPQGVTAPATGVLERLGFRADETGAHVLELAPLVEEEIREFKSRAWGTEKIVESYEKRIYRRSGVVQVKNRVETAYACSNASGGADYLLFWTRCSATGLSQTRVGGGDEGVHHARTTAPDHELVHFGKALSFRLGR